MKPKIAPTSPKARITEEAVNELYQSDHQFVTPSRGISVWAMVLVTLVVALVVGALAPAGVTALSNRFPSIGWLNKIKPGGSDTDTVVIRETPAVPVQASERRSQMAERLRPGVVAIYATHGETDVLSAAYWPAQAKGYGIVGTSDGVIVTTAEVVPDSRDQYVVARTDGTVAKVTKIIRDSLTPFVMLVIESSGESAVKLAASLPTASGADLFLLRPTAPRVAMDVRNAALVDPSTLRLRSSNDLIESTEAYQRVVTISPIPDSGWDGAALVNDKDEVIGLWSEDAGGVLPLGSVAPLIASSKDKDAIVRFDIGIHYVDLSQRLGLPAKLRDAYSSTGALITGSADSQIPAIRPKSPASQLRIKAGDVILKVDGDPIDASHNLTLLLQSKKSGDEAVLTVRQGTATRTLPLKISTAQ